MRNKLRIYSHNINGNGLLLLKEKLGCLAMHRNNPIASVTNVVNWGCNTTPRYHNRPGLSWLNHPSKVQKYSNKKMFFENFEPTNLPILKSIMNADDAFHAWRSGHVLYQRSALNGHGGEGIVVLSPDTPIRKFDEDCLLWTVKENLVAEYRVNVFRNPNTGEISIPAPQRKRRVNGWRELGNFSEEVKSEHTGWAFSNLRDEDANDEYTSSNIQRFVEDKVFSVPGFDLDFCGLDVGLSDTGDFIIIEVNTAPGLGNVSGSFYANCFRSWVEKEDEAVEAEQLNEIGNIVDRWLRT